MAKISGILMDGAGQVINDCTIELYAKKTTNNVLTQTQAFTVTSDGKYSMNVSPCEYDVSLIINGFPKKRLGSINVYSDSRNGTLNDFLINPKESELTPEFIKQVMDARDDAKKSANNAQKWASTIDTSTLVKKSGDTMTGQLILSELGIKHRYTDSENLMVLRTIGDNYSHMLYDAEKKQWQSKLVYSSSTNSWNFPSIDDVKINNKSVLKTGDYGIGSLTGPKIDNPDETLKGGCYATRTTEFTELTEYQNRNDSASLVVYPAWTEKWYVEKLAVVQSKTPRIYYRCATPNGKQPFYESITTANINNYLPVGVPLPWPTNQPPAGWLECNGSTFDKNKFPKLAVVYPTGKLPDLRGVFIRGKDNLRGLDPYRDILSYQDDAIRNIKGGLPTGNFKALLGHAKIDAGDKNGAILTQSAGDDYIASSASSTNPRQLRWMFFDFDASRVVPTANENRPRNVAFNYIVKAE